MSKGWRRGAMLVCVVAMAMVFASPTQAQVIHTDTSLQSESPQKESSPEGGAIFIEPPSGDLEKGFDRQLSVPETGASGAMDTNMLKMPDRNDAENARESDSRSGVSF